MKTKVLILGSGIAGLYAALKISQFADVVLVTKKEKSESNTNYAQGGIASVMSMEDSFQSHLEDTLIAGAGLCDRRMVEILVKEGPAHIQELIALGTQFTRSGDKLELAREGGHSHQRIVHAKDLTGKEVERALLDQASKKENIRLLENHLAIELITEHHIASMRSLPSGERHCWGAYILDIEKNRVIRLMANITVLATGGLGQVYLHTTNPTIATGDGYAMAYRAGAVLANMEFVQFHPTALYENTVSSGSGRAFLISEAVRGFGGKLLNLSGERFMARYDQRLELAPRDIVARAIDNELKRRGDDYVLLDISHKSSQALQDSFPNIYAKCKSIGIDLTVDPIPVVPAAHYACGGVTVDEYGRTTLNNLFAAGEVTMTGVHGANRLASNSLLEALVFASRAAEGISRSLKMTDAAMPDIPDWDDTNTLTSDEKVLISHSAKELKQLMWDYVGIVRSDLRLKYAERRAENLYREVESFYKTTKVFPSLIELRNLITCSRMIIESSLMRKENRGLHFSLDYVNAPQIDLPSNSIIQNPYLNT